MSVPIINAKPNFKTEIKSSKREKMLTCLSYSHEKVYFSNVSLKHCDLRPRLYCHTICNSFFRYFFTTSLEIEIM